jgi:hypothetical protein
MKSVKWSEPPAYLRARANDAGYALNPSYFHSLAFGTAGGLFVLAQLLRLVRNSQMSVWAEALISVLVGFVVGYFVPILNLLTPPRVWIDDRGLHRRYMAGDKRITETWKWEQMRGYQVARVMYAGEAYDELRIDTGGDAPLLFGLDGKALQSEFAEAFHKHRPS